MILYAIALYLHIVGALGIFAAFALELAAIAGLRRADTAEQVREWRTFTTRLRVLGPVALALLLVPGIYMAAGEWRGAQWPWVGLGAMVLLPALGAPSGIRLARVQRALESARGSLAAAQRRALTDPLLTSSIRVRLMVSLGIVFLMTVKPGVDAGLAAIGISLALGAMWSAPLWIGRRPENDAVRT